MNHSNNQGSQLEFLCDKCGSGFMSRFVTNKVGMAAGVLHAAGSLFGGIFGQAASAGGQVKEMMRGSARDEAFAAAVEGVANSGPAPLRKLQTGRRSATWSDSGLLPSPRT